MWFCLFNSELNPSSSEHTFGLLWKAMSFWFTNCMPIKLFLASDQIFASQEFLLTNTFDKRKTNCCINIKKDTVDGSSA